MKLHSSLKRSQTKAPEPRMAQNIRRATQRDLSIIDETGIMHAGRSKSPARLISTAKRITRFAGGRPAQEQKHFRPFSGVV